jgi:hypothetical protein
MAFQSQEVAVDSMMVMIRLTGLLLFSPAGQNGGPMHILMPGMPSHVAQIGFRKDTRTGCQNWVGGVCYVSLENSTIELGRPGRSQRVTLPPGNVSRAVDKRVAASHLQAVPQDVPALKGRLTLHEGKIEHLCSLGRFALQQGASVDTINLVNVVEWKYWSPGEQLVLTRRRLRENGPQDTTWNVDPDRTPTRTVELFIRHIPSNEAGEVQPAATSMKVGDPVEHFEAFYKLLSPETASGPIPHFVGALDKLCPWPVSTNRTFMTLRHDFLPPVNAGTMSCMVGAGDPPSTVGLAAQHSAADSAAEQRWDQRRGRH